MTFEAFELIGPFHGGVICSVDVQVAWQRGHLAVASGQNHLALQPMQTKYHRRSMLLSDGAYGVFNGSVEVGFIAAKLRVV